MFEIKHLKTLAALANTGNIRKAADVLFVSQSALSHQLKDLEQRLNEPLFTRNTSPIEFTDKGKILLNLADDILPKISNTLGELKADSYVSPQLNLAIACHACFQWLLPVTVIFSQQYPELKIEFIEQFFTTQSENKSPQIDVLFTDEKIENDDFTYHALGRFEVVAVIAKGEKVEHNSLTSKQFLNASDFSNNILLTYPVEYEHLDVCKLFLNKEENSEKYKPKTIKQVANSHMILQMVAANMGIATLPDWLVNSLSKQSLVQTKHIGKKGIFKTLYARYKKDNKQLNIIKQLIPQTVAAFDNLYNTDIIK